MLFDNIVYNDMIEYNFVIIGGFEYRYFIFFYIILY